MSNRRFDGRRARALLGGGVVLVALAAAIVVVVVIGLHVWGAIQDGREEKAMRAWRRRVPPR
jgi:hypothetical protein